MVNFLYPTIFTSSVPFDSCFDLTKGKVDKDMLDKAHDLMQACEYTVLSTHATRAVDRDACPASLPVLFRLLFLFGNPSLTGWPLCVRY